MLEADRAAGVPEQFVERALVVGSLAVNNPDAGFGVGRTTSRSSN